MKRPSLLLTVLVLGLVAAAFLWRLIEGPERGTGRDGAREDHSPAEGTPPSAELSTPLQLATADETVLAAAPAAAPAPASAERTSAPVAGRTLRGEVVLPSGAPPDGSLRVLALAENLAPSKIYGGGGVVEDLAGDERPSVVLGVAQVGARGEFTLPLSSEATVFLAVEGRFLYSRSTLAVPAGEASARLEPTLGAFVTGIVRLPPGVSDPAGAFAGLELELRPDSGDFALGASDLPLRRKAKADSEGRFEVRAVQAGLPQALAVDAKACADTVLAGLEFTPGETRALEVPLTLGATVRGLVQGPSGAPVSGAKVRAAEPGFWGFPGESVAETETGADGTFTLAHVRAGKTMLLSSAEGLLDGIALEFELRDAEDRNVGALVLEAGAALAGRALFPDGTPAVGAAIDVGFDPAALVGMGAMNAARGAQGKATCAADGGFRVGGLGKGPFRVTAKLDRDPGPAEDEWRAKVSGVAPGVEDLRLELSAPTSLAGRVLDRTGAPIRKGRVVAAIPGAVFFEPATRREAAYENEAGEFRLTDLDPGKWSVHASAEGFGPSAPVEVVVPRETTEPFVITLAPAASVAGTVLDPGGAPVAGAKVALQADTTQQLERLRGDRDQPEALSGEDGSFVLAGLAEGRKALEARAPGFAGSEAVEVDLRAGETIQDVVLRLRRGAVVTGEVYGKDGAPAAGVRVIAQSPGGLEMSMKQADGEGRFRIDGLDPGSWTITALLGTGGNTGEGEADQAAASMLENLRFTLVQLEEGEEAHVVLGAPPKDPVLVRGRVRHGGDPVRDGMVSFFAQGAKSLEALKIAPLGADGAFEVRLDEPGTYAISVQVTGGTGAFQQHTIEFRETIPETEEHALELALPLGGVHGKVHGPDREPLANARVSLVTEGGLELGSMMGSQYSEAVTDAEGVYAFDYLRPGVYTVAAGGALFGGAFGNETLAGRALRAGLTVDEGRVLEGVDFQLESPGSLGGRVTDGGGLPVKDVALFVRDASGRLIERFSMTATGADGTFEYKGLAPGEYVVSARGKGLVSLESAPVRVKAGARASVDLVLQPGTKLVIEVAGEEGPVEGVRVSVTDPNGRDMQGMLGWAEMTTLFADGFDSAKQVVGPLAAGTYSITAVTPDGKKTSRSLTLDGQPERRLKLRLR